MRPYTELLTLDYIQAKALLHILDCLESRFLVVESTRFALLLDPKSIKIFVTKDHLCHD
jgi:hypothetical protein